jgi:hypothetical protein
MHEDPLSRVNFSDYVPQIEKKKNKKNESCLNFAHRVDLKILRGLRESQEKSLERRYDLKKHNDQLFSKSELTLPRFSEPQIKSEEETNTFEEVNIALQKMPIISPNRKS